MIKKINLFVSLLIKTSLYHSKLKTCSFQNATLSTSNQRFVIVREKARGSENKLKKLLDNCNLSQNKLGDIPWLNEIEPSLLSYKLGLLNRMNFKNEKHLVPYLKLPSKTLVSLLKITNSDHSNKNCDNRLYYLAEKLNVDPEFLSTKITRRMFIYTLSFDWLKASLETCLEFGLPKERIVKDLWVLKYNHDTIRKRLEKVKKMGRTDLAPWMVRCPEDVLDRSLQISTTTSTVLGDYVSTQDYLKERLKTTQEAIKDIFARIPAMKYRRASKFKNILDYLFSQGFTETDILQCVRILLHSLSTTKKRLEKLKSCGIEVRNLNVLCKTEKNFNRYLELVKYMPKQQYS